MSYTLGQYKEALGIPVTLQVGASEVRKPAPAKSRGRFVRLQQARLAWASARSSANQQIEQVAAKLTASHPEETEIANGIQSTLDHFSGALTDRLDDALNASDPTTRAQLQQQAVQILDRYLDFVMKDDLVAHIATNPFHTVSFQTDLEKTITELKTQLAA
jgi:hypothetical protein